MSNLKVRTILVSQPEPKVENSPYFDLQQKHKVKIDFRSFIHVEGVSAKDVRAQKIDLNNFTAIKMRMRFFKSYTYLKNFTKFTIGIGDRSI